MTSEDGFLHEVGVLAACQRIHMGVTGSSDGIGEEERRLVVSLRDRLINWEPNTCGYDRRVKELVQETLLEFDDWSDTHDR